MSLVLKIGATLTGGTDKTYASAGLSAGGKATFVAPEHTQLEPRVLDVFRTAAVETKDSLGVARAGFKVSFASRTTEEGCCNGSSGTAIFDGSIRWPLSQPVAIVDDVIAAVRGFVYSTAFEDMIKKGILPQ